MEVDGGKVGDTERRQIIGDGGELDFILHVMQGLKLGINKTTVLKH